MARSWIRTLTRRSVVAHLTNDGSIRGVLVGVHGDCIVLAHARWLAPDGTVVPIDGDAVIPRTSVAWVQDLPAAVAELTTGGAP